MIRRSDPRQLRLPMNERAWSHYQEAIFDDTLRGKGATVARARAGCAKTTTAVEAMVRLPFEAQKSSVFFAFNRSVANELKKRAPRNAHVSTVHAHGLNTLRRAGFRVEIDDSKLDRYVLDRPGLRAGDIPTARRLIALAKSDMAVTWRGLEEAEVALEEVADARDVDLPADEGERSNLLRIAASIVEESAMIDHRRKELCVDFDDMVYLPVRHRLTGRPYSHVFVDELQDLSRAQVSLAMSSMEEGGRVLGLGDDRQSIYGWRGADSDAMSRFVSDQGAKILPLPRTYRCGKVMVELARKYVPDFEADERNPRGSIERCGEGDLAKWIKPGDFLIARSNAPLLTMCVRLLASGVPAHMVGRDFGNGLLVLCDKSRETTVRGLLRWLDGWYGLRARRLQKLGRSLAKIQDRRDSLLALAVGCGDVSGLKRKIRDTFDDRSDRDRVTLSTVHRAKGLERDRVFMMESTFWSDKGDPIEEENLYYVAVTRARHQLWLVEGLPQ